MVFRAVVGILYGLVALRYDECPMVCEIAICIADAAAGVESDVKQLFGFFDLRIISAYGSEKAP